MVAKFPHDLSDWKQSPESVSYIAVPLALLGFLLAGMLAYLKYKIDGDYWYAVIVTVAVIVLIAGLYPMVKRRFIIKKTVARQTIDEGELK